MFGQRLKELRKKKHITQEQLAAIIGVERSSVGKYEGKSNIIPSTDVLNSLADYFGVSIDYLLGRDTAEQEPVDDFTYALYNETKELTEEDKQQLINMARFLKAQKENK